MIKVTAPGRCGLIGNPTDMYGGSVISCSTKERAECTLDDSVRSDFPTIEVSGVHQEVRETADLAIRGDYLDVARAVLLALDVTPGKTAPFALKASTTIPMQAGLAGSTAVIASIVGAVLHFLGLRLNPYETAELVRKIEYDTLGVVCGFQDHYMSVFGGLNFMDFRDKTSASAQDNSSPFATIERLHKYVPSLPLILAHTGVKHHSGTVHESIRDRWLRGDQDVVNGYLRIATLARLGKKALLAEDWRRVAQLMTENHAIQRSLGGSGDSNEAMIEAALSGGAIAAKLAGAGGGGTILALTFEREETIAALEAAGADAILFPEPSAGLTVEIV